MPNRSLCQFAEALRTLMACGDAASLDARWEAQHLDDEGWAGLAEVAASTDPAAAPLLAEVDRLLQQLREHLAAVAGSDAAGAHVRAFRQPMVERLQHAAAAAVVAHRFGTAGLAAVVGDEAAPLPRRYHALLLLAHLHASTTWPLFERYLTPEAHHAFVAVAIDAARYYPVARPGPRLLALFDAIRGDQHLRAFLGPRVLASLFVLADPVALPLYHELAVSGHTAPDPGRCEVTHALVMLRRLTGTVPPNSKFRDEPEVVRRCLDAAEAQYRRDRDVLQPVVVL
jgi:hypothetical protein